METQGRGGSKEQGVEAKHSSRINWTGTPANGSEDKQVFLKGPQDQSERMGVYRGRIGDAVRPSETGWHGARPGQAPLSN